MVARAMFLPVPALAGIVHLLSRKSGLNYPQHFYFALHLQAAWFFLAMVAMASRVAAIPWVTPLVPPLALLYAFVYLALAFRQAYRLTPARALVRSVTVMTVYAILNLGTFAAITLPLLAL